MKTGTTNNNRNTCVKC